MMQAVQLSIDENSFDFNHLSPQQCADALDQLCDRIEQAQADGHTVFYSDDLFWRQVSGAAMFYDLLNLPEWQQYRDVFDRMSVALARLAAWQESLPADAPQLPDTRTWVATQCQAGNPAAALVLSPPESGACILHQGTAIYLIATAANYAQFFRDLLAQSNTHWRDNEAWFASAFAGLAFVEGALAGIKDMEGDATALRCEVLRHFAVLADHGHAIFAASQEHAAKELVSLGVNASPENGNTKANQKAKKERTRHHQGRDIVFWWHSKLEKHRNRIHFYPDEVRDGKPILIGILCRHLST